MLITWRTLSLHSKTDKKSLYDFKTILYFSKENIKVRETREDIKKLYKI